MRKKTIRQSAVISAMTAEEFEYVFNERLKELAGKTIVDMNVCVETLTAIVIYEEDVDDEPKTVREEYNAAGYVFLCKQCPHIELPKDKRLRHVPCKYDEYGHTRLDCECCEMFYKELKQGEITPRYCR